MKYKKAFELEQLKAKKLRQQLSQIQKAIPNEKQSIDEYSFQKKMVAQVQETFHISLVVHRK